MGLQRVGHNLATKHSTNHSQDLIAPRGIEYIKFSDRVMRGRTLLLILILLVQQKLRENSAPSTMLLTFKKKSKNFKGCNRPSSNHLQVCPSLLISDLISCAHSGFLNKPEMLLPQGLCTCRSLCLEHSFPQDVLIALFSTSGPYSNISLNQEGGA